MRNENVIRLKRVIESDRMSFTAESLEVIIKDLSTVLSDYFKLSQKPKIKVEGKQDGYEVTVTVKADAIKTFAVIPENLR